MANQGNGLAWKNRRPEILAPVGGSDQLKAAVRCGADAVYFGLQNFNARRNADNFAGENLPQTIAYCHDHGVKVYITINTLVKDGEMSGMEEAVDLAASCGADGIIVQDLAVASYAKRCWPDLPLHASTQMAVHNAAGVRELLSYGFVRAVLARELSLPEMAEIVSETGAECEVFVHGAHCMSVSGNCYMSSMFGGRSGNRGLCAQPCRLDWKTEDGRDHVLSLKDMCCIPRLEALSDAGIASFKIEGRMKRPEYVAAAVTACREALEGRTPDIETLRSVFSRSGFTDGYLTGHRDASMFGYRTKEDVLAAEDALPRLTRLWQKEDAKIPVSMFFEAKAGASLRLVATCGGFFAEASGDPPAPAKTKALDDVQAEKSLSKTGDTPYELEALQCSIQPGLFVPAAALNALRRDALATLDIERNQQYLRIKADSPQPALPKYKAPVKPQLRLRLETADQAMAFGPDDADAIILPLKAVAANPRLAERFGSKLIPELPALVYGAKRKEQILKTLWALPECIDKAACPNIGSLEIARQAGLAALGAFELNVLNSRALEELQTLGLGDAVVSPELSFGEIRKLEGSCPRGILVYGRLPLMKCRACPGRGAKGCGECTGLQTLTDRTGARFPLLCREQVYSEILNSVPLYLGDRERPETDFEELYFTVESPGECKRIVELYKQSAPADFQRTAGLYFRKLL